MSKRFSILAAALVASGRSLSTTALDHLDARPIQRSSAESNVLVIERRSKPVFDGLDEALLQSALAISTSASQRTWAA